MLGFCTLHIQAASEKVRRELAASVTAAGKAAVALADQRAALQNEKNVLETELALRQAQLAAVQADRQVQTATVTRYGQLASPEISQFKNGGSLRQCVNRLRGVGALYGASLMIVFTAVSFSF